MGNVCLKYFGIIGKTATNFFKENDDEKPLINFILPVITTVASIIKDKEKMFKRLKKE